MARRRSHQKGSVKKRGGQWTLRYRERDHSTGKWTLKRVPLGEFKNEKAARAAADAIMLQANSHNSSPRSPGSPSRKPETRITFREFIEREWRAYTAVREHRTSTMHSHDSLIKNHLLPFLGEMEIRDITPGHISELFGQVRTRTGQPSRNTVSHLFGLLKLIFRIAVDADLIERSPVRPTIHRPESRADDEKPILRAEQIRAILSGLAETERLFVLLVAITGMRFGEALALCWSDFDAETQELRISHTLYRLERKEPKTPSSNRALKLKTVIAVLLEAHREHSAFRGERDYIFCRRDGRPMNSNALRTHLYRAMDKAGIERTKGKFGFHILRHTAGSLIYAKSGDLKLVQEQLGHSDISTTSDIYVHLEDKAVEEGTDILTREILGELYPSCTQESEMVS